jgi:threonine synthase
VPTGNFGNVLAGWLAQRMGALPGTTFRVATNQNDILHRFFSTGEYVPRVVHPSYAPSMDIQIASNFDRFLFYLLDRNPAALREAMAELTSSGTLTITPVPADTFRASRCDDAAIHATIAEVWQKFGYAIDPHTACGFAAQVSDRRSILLATAHPAKFPQVVKAATGTEPTHPALEALKQRPLKSWPLAGNERVLKDFIREQISRPPVTSPPLP